MAALEVAACVYTYTHTYANNHITHTRPPCCWWAQNNEKRKKSKRRRRKRRRKWSDKAWQIQFETATLSCWQNAAMSRALPQCEIYLLCCCRCVSYHSPFVLLCAAAAGWILPAAWTATAALAYPSFVAVAFTTVAFILLLCILILLIARAVASLQN